MKTNVKMLPDILDVIHIKEVLNIGQRQAYDLVKSGQFHSVRVGKRIKISKKSFIDWLDGTKK